MAINLIREEIKGIYNNINPAEKGGRSRTAREAQDAKFAFEIKIDASTFSKQMSLAINTVVDDESFTTEADFLPITRDVLKNIEKLPGMSSPIVSVEQVSNGVIITRAQPQGKINNSLVSNLNRSFRAKVLERWKKETKKGKGTKGIDETQVKEAKELGFSHNQESNVANAKLLDFIQEEDLGVFAITQSERKNIAMVIFEALEIDWEHKVDPISGKAEWIIKGELAGKNPEYDKLKDLGQPWEDEIIRKLELAVKDSKFANRPDAIFSKPFTEVVSEEAVRKIAKPYKKVSGAKITGLPKKNKKSTRKGRAKNSTKAPKSKTVKIGGVAHTTTMRKEKGSARSTEEGAIQLAKLRKYIQSRLPAEVRRNMGRPALINRTGRFSNSVQLLSLMEGKNTVIAKYTYLLSPYETFENSGRRKWPVAYNPKTLIAKSIRNLAEGRIAQKLTVRRV